MTALVLDGKTNANASEAGSITLPAALKQKIKDGLFALSLSNLCFISAWFSPLSDADYGFFNDMRLTNATLLALLTNIGIFTVVIWTVMQMLHRFKNALFHFLMHLLFLALILAPADFVRSEFHPMHPLMSLVRQPIGMFCFAVGAGFVLWQHRLVARVVGVMVGAMFPLALLIITKVILLCVGVIHLRQQDADPTFPPLAPVRADQPRVVWMIFDEMDYRLLFEQPPQGFSFPEFHRFHDEALSADSAIPPADKTVISIPSLMAGRRVISAALTNAYDLRLTLYQTGSVANVETTNFSQLWNVFSEAHTHGLNSAVVGWYLPYSRLLSTNINYCAWHAFPDFQPARAPTYTGALKREAGCLLGPLHIRRQFVDLEHRMVDESVSVATNGNYSLTFLHFYPPHLPNVYLPDQDRFTLWDQKPPVAYYNNLVLADHILGQLRRSMEAAGQWDKTWVVISADHSWRISKTYLGVRDYRVPFMVKAPGASTSATYSRPFNTSVTPYMVMAILNHQVTNTVDLGTWLADHGRDRPINAGMLIEGSIRE